ncbi:MAG: D-alanyl-D-alanine carboxypeptidase, partial [Ferruginibacter sp.]
MFQRIIVPVFSILIFQTFCYSQNLSTQLEKAIEKLSGDPQFKHAILSLYVIDSKTGKLLYDKNSEIGMAAASCQKVITSVTAFEMLGKEFQFKTNIGYDQKISSG